MVCNACVPGSDTMEQRVVVSRSRRRRLNKSGRGLFLNACARMWHQRVLFSSLPAVALWIVCGRIFVDDKAKPFRSLFLPHPCPNSCLSGACRRNTSQSIIIRDRMSIKPRFNWEVGQEQHTQPPKKHERRMLLQHNAPRVIWGCFTACPAKDTWDAGKAASCLFINMLATAVQQLFGGSQISSARPSKCHPEWLGKSYTNLCTSALPA